MTITATATSAYGASVVKDGADLEAVAALPPQQRRGLDPLLGSTVDDNVFTAPKMGIYDFRNASGLVGSALTVAAS